MVIRYSGAAIVVVCSLLSGCGSLAESTLADEHVSEIEEVNYLTLPDLWFKELVLFEDYAGDLEGLLILASAMGGLNQPEIIGNKPTTSRNVLINRGTYTILDAFRYMDAQADGYASVQANPAEMRVTLEYSK